jgi:hypothetical protein
MRAAATSISSSDSWLAWAAVVGLAPAAPESTGDGRALPLLAVCGMLLGTLILNLVRRRLEGVLETWRRDSAVSSAETLGASASQRGE